MKNRKPPKPIAMLPAAQLVSAKELQAMITYLKNFEIKYSRNKTEHKK